MIDIQARLHTCYTLLICKFFGIQFLLSHMNAIESDSSRTKLARNEAQTKQFVGWPAPKNRPISKPKRSVSLLTAAHFVCRIGQTSKCLVFIL